MIRHAPPLRDGGRPPAEWDLDPDGIGAILGLADALKALGLQRLVTSNEHKAVQTGSVLGDLLDLPTSSDPRLNEVHRPPVAGSGAFTRSVWDYLAGSSIAGWEPRQSVVERMHAAVEDALANGASGIVSHGTAIALFLEHLGLVRAPEFWSDLTSPDAWLVDEPAIKRLGSER